MFVFDDIRLYVKLKKPETLPDSNVYNIEFEIQVKTYLQHAWSIATHDLMYKSDDINWAKQRIAYQIKAMLEHAEISIGSANDLSKSPGIPKTNSHFKKLLEMKALIEDKWDKALLSSDMIRMSENILNLMDAIGLRKAELIKVLDSETESGRGVKITNLSPFMIIIQSLINTKNEKLKKYLCSKQKKGSFKILLTSEIELNDFFDSILQENVCC